MTPSTDFEHKLVNNGRYTVEEIKAIFERYDDSKKLEIISLQIARIDEQLSYLKEYGHDNRKLAWKLAAYCFSAIAAVFGFVLALHWPI